VGLVSSAVVMSIVSAALLLTFPISAQAQALEEIIVTARKTEESLQDVPISISAFSSQQMQDRGIRDNYDVARFTPNFSTIQRVGRDTDRPIIRGMVNPGSRGEPNASYFIDGTFVARTISTATTQSMERVEVLRGPQSAIFGRATFSGAVNYVTRRPTNDYEGQLNVRAGSSEDKQLAAWFSGPFVEDKLLFLVSGAYEHYGHQWNNNLQPDTAFVNGFLGADIFDGQSTEGDTSPLGQTETLDFLAKLTYAPSDATDFNFKWSYTDTDDSQYLTNIFDTLNCQLPNDPSEAWFETSRGAYCGEYKIDGTENRKNLPDLRNGLVVPQGGITGTVDDLPLSQRTSDPVEPGLRRETNRYLGEYFQDIYGWTSELQASYSTDFFDSAYDLDHQEVRAVWGLFAFNNVFDTTDYSFEYSIASPVDNSIRGKLGVYVYRQELIDMQRSVTGPLAAFDTSPGTDFQDPRTQNIDNQSVFGSAAFDLTEQWTLNLEARYAVDDKDMHSGQRNQMNESAPVIAALSYSSFTPRITLEYRPTDDLMVYFMGANGTKPGGFNTEYFRSDISAEFTEFLLQCDPQDPSLTAAERVLCEDNSDTLTFEEEEQWTYEVGFKSTWWDQRILANLSVFYIDWKNQGLFANQVLPNASGTTNTSTLLINAGTSEIYGLEIESNYAVTDNVTLIANYGYNHGRFKEGIDPDLAQKTGGDGNLAGKTLPDSPAHQLVLGFDMRAQLSPSLGGFLRGDYLYESMKYTRPANFGNIGSRGLINFRTGIDGDAWTLTFYIRNLLDEDTPIALFNFVDFAAQKKGQAPGATGQYDFVDLADGTPMNGTISTRPPDPGNPDPALVLGAANDGEVPNMGALNPQPGRDLGLEFQYRF
jgi:outer membrane receptor protein involved in Fe transport